MPNLCRFLSNSIVPILVIYTCNGAVLNVYWVYSILYLTLTVTVKLSYFIYKSAKGIETLAWQRKPFFLITR